MQSLRPHACIVSKCKWSVDLKFAFEFNAQSCENCNGFCCRGESGYVFVSYAEITALAAYLKSDIDCFMRQYVRKVGYRFSLLEKPLVSQTSQEFACCFFDPLQQRCAVYEVRPNQCKTFPFWERFATIPYEEIQKECPFIKPL